MEIKVNLLYFLLLVEFLLITSGLIVLFVFRERRFKKKLRLAAQQPVSLKLSAPGVGREAPKNPPRPEEAPGNPEKEKKEETPEEIEDLRKKIDELEKILAEKDKSITTLEKTYADLEKEYQILFRQHQEAEGKNAAAAQPQ
jgi:flagellar motor protein MotB